MMKKCVGTAEFSKAENVSCVIGKTSEWKFSRMYVVGTIMHHIVALHNLYHKCELEHAHCVVVQKTFF